MDENVKHMKLTHLLSTFPPNLMDPFMYISCTSKKFIAFLDARTRKTKNNTFPFYILCVLIPQIIPILTLPLVSHVVRRVHPPGIYTRLPYSVYMNITNK